MLTFVITILLKLVGAVIFFFILPYLFYYNVYKFYRTKWFYERQDCVHKMTGTAKMLPIIGSIRAMLECLKQMEEQKSNKAIATVYYDNYVGEWKPVCHMVVMNELWTIISDPIIAEVMYTTKNKYFNKHYAIRELTYCLTGDTILFAETSAEWRARRKTLSPAFYKGKLIKMVEIARSSVGLTVAHLKGLIKECAEPRRKIDLIDKVSDMSVRTLLMCATG